MLANRLATKPSVALLFHLALSVPTQSTAEQKKEDLFAVVSDVCTVSARRAMEELQPLLTNEPKLRGIESGITFSPTDQYMARAHFGFKRVEISRGFCYHNWLINWSQALAVATGKIDHIPGYGKYLASQSAKFTATGGEGEVRTFEQYANIDLSKVPKATLEAAQFTAISNMQGIFAFAIAHELGHFALDHKPANELLFTEARRQELAADRFAIRLIAKGNSKYAEMGSILSLSLNTLAEREIGKPFAFSSYHPSAMCRMAIMDEEAQWLEWFETNPASKARLEKASGESIATMIARRQMTIKSCPTP